MKIIFKEVKSPEQRDLFKSIINQYHSYMDHASRVGGRKIDALVYQQYGAVNILVGAIGIKSCVYNLASRDSLLNLTKANKPRRLRNGANNYRFCIIPGKARGKNAGSQILSSFRRWAPRRWKYKYGNKLSFIETFVKKPRTGAVYKADNWRYIGETKGYSIKRNTIDRNKWEESRTDKKGVFLCQIPK